MTPGKFHPWHAMPGPSRAARELHEEKERLGIIEAARIERVASALVRLADGIEKIESLDELERDDARDRALCDAVVRGAAGPRRIVDDAE